MGELVIIHAPTIASSRKLFYLSVSPRKSLVIERWVENVT